MFFLQIFFLLILYINIFLKRTKLSLKLLKFSNYIYLFLSFFQPTNNYIAFSNWQQSKRKINQYLNFTAS